MMLTLPQLVRRPLLTYCTAVLVIWTAITFSFRVCRRLRSLRRLRRLRTHCVWLGQKAASRAWLNSCMATSVALCMPRPYPLRLTILPHPHQSVRSSNYWERVQHFHRRVMNYALVISHARWTVLLRVCFQRVSIVAAHPFVHLRLPPPT